MGEERRERGTKSQRGGEGRRDWNGEESKRPLAGEDSTWIFDQGPPSDPSYATGDQRINTSAGNNTLWS